MHSISPEADVLLRERFNSLSRLVPVMYVAIFVDGILMTYLFWGTIHFWIQAILTVSILALVVWRSIYWIKLRGRAYDLDLKEIQKAIRSTEIVGPILAVVYSVVGFFLMREGTPIQQSMTLMLIWIVAAASSFCVFSLPLTAMLILLASSVPMILALVLNGDSMLIAETPAFVAVAALMIYVLRENMRTFTEIVNSRSAMKRMQEELSHNHEHLALAQRVSSIGSAEVDLRSGAVMWSDHLFTLLEQDPVWVNPSVDAFVAAVHPEDQEMVREAATKNYNGEAAPAMEFRVRCANGTIRWLSWASSVLTAEDGSPEGFVWTVHDVTERKYVEIDVVAREAELRRSNEHLSRAQKLGKVGSSEYSHETGETWWSDEQYAVLGLVPGKDRPDAAAFLSRVHPDDLKKVKRRLKARAQGLSVDPMEYRVIHPNGEVRWVYGQSEAVVDADGNVTMIGTMHDITARKHTEAQLTQAQKMEAVGHLTGGVAHDFNNLLAVILGRLQLLDEELGDRPDLQDWVRSSLKAVERGGTLTKSLLAFSRRQTLVPVELDLNAVIDDVEDLLRRTLGEAYEFHVSKADALWRVEADPSQLQNALVNLVLNARDAMPKGGTLTVETVNSSVESEEVAGLAEGDYVVMAVKDTGIGMSREVAERAFEPFFTTKDIDKGTGLGLSMVYGFVKQSGGHVAIESQVGQGTTVRIYLPRKAAAQAATDKETELHTSPPRGTETILVVEDNDELRQLIQLQLQRLGYTVYDASHGADGLHKIETDPSIDLLLTDVIMPQGMSGIELAEKAMALRPDLKVEFMSGYSEPRDILEFSRGRPPFRLLQKPFHIRELAILVRAALDDRQAAAAGQAANQADGAQAAPSP